MSSAQSPGARRVGRRATRPLQPGDAVGVALLTGDFELGATGTVTHVDGDRVYAFGHPLYNLGPTQFPMTRAEVQVVLPSLMASSKLASFGEVVGTVQQDRATAIAGRLGPAPSLIPVTITLNSDRGPSRTFNFGVVRDFTFTPLLTYLVGRQRADVVRARRRSGVVRDPRQRLDSIRRRSVVRRHLQRRSAGGRRGRLRRRAADGAAEELRRERRGREDRADDRRQRAAAQRAHRARVARHDAPARRTGRDRQRRAAIGARPGNRPPGADPDSGEPDRIAAADGRRRRAHRPRTIAATRAAPTCSACRR